LIRKKFFVLVSILLVGVVLLSGCLGGGTDISNDNDISDLEDEAVINSAFNELEKNNFNEAEKYFADDFIQQGYDETISLSEFFSFFEDDIYEDEYIKEVNSITNIEINDLVQTASSATEKEFRILLLIEGTYIYKDLENNTEEKEVNEYEEEMLITINNNNKISSIKEIYPEEEIKMLESLVQTIETENKVDFESYFAENNSILDYSDYESSEPFEFNNPAELYDFILNNYQTDNINFYYYYFETIDPNNVLINFEMELDNNNDNLYIFDIDATIKYDNGDLKITSLEIW